VSVTALRDARDAIIGFLPIGTDNTARKLVETEQQKLDERLRDQQFYTRSLIESNVDALMTTDPSGIITDVNKEMEALTGCTRDELIGAPFKGYFTDPERAEAGIKHMLSERKVTNYELTACARGAQSNSGALQRDHLLRPRPHATRGLRRGARRYRAQARRGGTAAGQGRSRECQSGQVGSSGEHEPRNPNTDKCDHRRRRTAC
jgi:PAS domain-containing protein